MKKGLGFWLGGGGAVGGLVFFLFLRCFFWVGRERILYLRFSDFDYPSIHVSAAMLECVLQAAS